MIILAGLLVASLVPAHPAQATAAGTGIGPAWRPAAGLGGGVKQYSGGATGRTWPAADGVAVGDVDGDGRDDVVRGVLDATPAAPPATTGANAAGPGASQGEVWFGRADRGAERVGLDLGVGLAVTAIDQDGDGVDELLWYDPEAAKPAQLWFRSGPRRWSAQEVAMPPAHSTPVVADITGDGRQDVLWHGGAHGDVLSRSRPAGGFGIDAFWPEAGLTPFAGNFDGDGATDVIWYDSATGRGVLWWGGVTLSAAPFDIGTGSTLRVGQFDGVGGEDLLVTGPNGYVELDGQPDRQFTPTTVAAWTAPDSLVADVNADGRSDIVTPGVSPGVWNNDASGWLWEPWDQPPTAPTIANAVGGGVGPLLVGDLDGDGADEVFSFASSNAGGPAAGVWQWGRRREDIFRQPNPWAAPGGLVVRMLGLVGPRRVDPPLVPVLDACARRWLVHAATADLAQSLLDSAAADGVSLCVNFGFRSYAEQAALRGRRCGEVGFGDDRGCIYDWASGVWPFEGANQAQRPGYSRHQLGVALDLGDRDGYATATVTAWLSVNAHRFGFYNLGDRQRLGPGWTWGAGGEPWHISLDGR